MLDINTVYGKKSTVIPGKNVIQTLQKRLDFLTEKLQSKTIEDQDYVVKRYSYLVAEIRALDKAITFLQWLSDNSEDITVDNIKNKYKVRNK
jgi:hypothetical protein